MFSYGCVRMCMCFCEYASSCAHTFIHRVSDLNPGGGQWKVSLYTKENTAHLRQHYLSPHLSVYPSPNLSLVPPSSYPPLPLPAQSPSVYLCRSLTNQSHQSVMFCLLIGCSNEVLQVNSTDSYPPEQCVRVPVCVFVCACKCVSIN